MYGRDFELSSLSAAFSRTIARYATDAKSEVVLVSGMSGTGKTFFVKNGMAEIMSSSSGFYASGKCAQLEQNHPYSCVVDLFTSLCNRVSEEEKEMPSCKIRSGIRQSLQADDCFILSGLIPKIGEMLDLSTTSTTDSQNNENLHSSGKEQHACVLRSLRRFVRAVASWGTVVLFLDDLQWIDEASLDLIQLLVLDDHLKGFLLIGTYRDNEVGPGHILVECFKKFEAEAVNMTQIYLGHLQKTHVIDIVADMLRISHKKAEPLAKFVHKHTDGHALFVCRLLEYLREKKFLKLNHSQWEWDLGRIEAAGVPNTLDGVLADEMIRMPETAQDFLKTAAAIGLFFDDFTIDLILSSLEQDSRAWSESKRENALQETLQCSMERGFIQSTGDGSHQFNHDRMWQASYNLTPEKEREVLHLQIGRRLLRTLRQRGETYQSKNKNGGKNSDSSGKRSAMRRKRKSDAEFRTRQLFVTVDQLNRGRELIVDPNEREDLISLNIDAANAAIRSSAFHPAIRYLKSGITILPENNWMTQYKLSLKLFCTLANVASSIGNYDLMNECVDQVLQNGENIIDKFEAYHTLIKSLTFRKHPDEAIGTALSVLDQLGYSLKWSKADVRLVTFQIRRLMKNQTKESIMALPDMTDEWRLKAMCVMAEMLGTTYGSRPDLFTLLCCKISRWSIKYGVSKSSIQAFTGMAQLNIIPNRDDEMCQTSLALLERFDAKGLEPLLLMLIYGYIQHRTTLIHDCLEPLSKGFTLGTQIGMIEHAGYNCSLLCSYAFFSGERLDRVESKMYKFLLWMDEYKFSGNTRKSNLIFSQAVQCLQGKARTPFTLEGTFVIDLNEMIDKAKGNNLLKCTLDTCRLELYYLFHQYKEAGTVLENALDIIKLRPGHFSAIRFTFYECLASIQLAKTSKNKAWATRASNAKSKFFKWAKLGNVNCDHMVSLIEAETAAMEGAIDKAATMYNDITIDSKDIPYLQDRALAYERAGLFFKEIKSDVIAKQHFNKAQQYYADWGAKAKKIHALQQACYNADITQAIAV